LLHHYILVSLHAEKLVSHDPADGSASSTSPPTTAPGRPARLLKVVALLFIVTVVSLTAANISAPGLEYDETLFVNAALGGHASLFAGDRALGIPLFLLPYIGALKSFAYYPIFALFGVSVTSIRLPILLVMGLTLWITYRLASRLFSEWTALALLAVVGTDPALLFLSKTDLGPIVLMTLLKIASLYFLVRYLREGRMRYLVRLYVALSLGVYDKLNFLWFVIGLGVASLALWPDIRAALQRTGRPAYVATGIFAGACAVYAAVRLPLALRQAQEIATFHGVTPGSTGLAAHVAQTAGVYASTFDGSGVLRAWTGAQPAFATWGPSVALVGCGGALILGVRAVARPEPRGISLDTRWAWFFVVLSAVIFMEIAATPAIVGFHHVFMLWALGAFSVAAAARAGRRILRSPRLVRILTAAGLSGALLITVTNVAADMEYLGASAGKSTFTPAFSTAIYSLSAVTEKSAPHVSSIITADWGIETQLYALASWADRPKYVELWSRFYSVDTSSPAALAALRHQYFDGRRTLIILHTPSMTEFPLAREHFMGFVNATKVALVLVAQISDGGGRPVFDVYLARAMGGAAGP
jgi:4-amino-4-deoxy-L-arabinose transferase-like glycosyltransferase